MHRVEIRVDERLEELGAHVYCIVVAPVTVRESSERLDEEIRSIEESIRAKYRDPSVLRDDPIVRAYRDFLWRLGIDPTKTRPSSEALVRRILRRGSMPRINNIVDSGNAASALTLVPIGLYDMDRVSTPLSLTLSSSGVEFRPVGSDKTITLKEGTPILVDSTGKVMHIYPYRDSRDTMIRGETRRVLAIAAGVRGVPETLLRRALSKFVELLRVDGLEPAIIGECYTR